MCDIVLCINDIIYVTKECGEVMNVIFSVAAVNIGAEVTAQVDYVILYSGKSGQLEHIKLTEKRCPRRLIMLCCFRMSLGHAHENSYGFSVVGFHRVDSRRYSKA